MNRPQRSKILASVLGFCLPGAGQIYCAQDNKGVFLIGLFLLGHWATGGISSLLLCPAMSLDALLIAEKMDYGEKVARWEFFPRIKFINKLSPRVVPLAMIIFLAAIIIARILIYASDYRPGE
jgi:TM2 domain-containing membrane protein YozV